MTGVILSSYQIINIPQVVSSAGIDRIGLAQLVAGLSAVVIGCLAIWYTKNLSSQNETFLKNQKKAYFDFLDKQQRENHEFLGKQQSETNKFLVLIQKRVEAVALCHFAANSNYNYLSLLIGKIKEQKEGTESYNETLSEIQKILSDIDLITSNYKRLEPLD